MKPGGSDFLRDRIAGHFLPNPPERLAVAVSGGSDSLALLYLLKDWSDQGGPELHAVTVDHRLRAESGAEAAQVAAHAARLGVGHECLPWHGWDGQGNLPDQARRARYRLMADWAEARGIGHIALGHTADDQAETFLMRLARSAGVDGLSGMSATRRMGAVVLCRPALRVSRSALRAYLGARRIEWIEDPTNADQAYERVRTREVIAALAPLGITAATLTSVAGHMAEVRNTLYWYVFLAARDMVSFQAGDMLIDRRAFRTLQRDISRRLMQSALRWISSSDYAPRGRAMDLLMESIRGGTDMTLHGCRVLVGAQHLRITRELKAVEGATVPAGQVWDGRWRMTGPVDGRGCVIAALGSAGLRQCPDWRAAGLPEASQLSGPAIWHGETLVAAPLAGAPNGWRADLLRDEEDYFASLLSY